MKRMRAFLFSVLVGAFSLGSLACGGGGEGAPGTGIDSIGGEEIFPSTSLPAESPNPELFGIWTFKMGVVTQSCGAGSLDTSLYEQEIRIIPKEAGCSLSGEDETGNLLHAKLLTIFDVENTICNTGGDTLVFENTDSIASRDGSDCSINFRQVARLTRSGEILEGPMVAAVYFEGSQCTPEDVACSTSIMILASKGRHVVGGTPYLSPPPQPGPAPAPEPQPQPAPQQPAPSPVPPALVSDLNTDAIRNIVNGWLRRGGREGLPEADVVDGADGGNGDAGEGGDNDDVPSVPPNVRPVPVR